MEPKFQSSFIPKGPIALGDNAPLGRPTRERSLLAFLSIMIFSGSVLLAVGVFGYKFYLNYSIASMATELERGRATLQPETVSELTRLNDRILSTEELIDNHLMLSPLFKFLETSTLRTARFTGFAYVMTEQGLQLTMKGEAKGYSALVLQADLLNKSEYFKNPVFSDLNLDEKGNVGFSFTATVDPELLSYRREVEKLGVPPVLIIVPVATTTAATTTPSTSSTSSPQASSGQATPN